MDSDTTNEIMRLCDLLKDMDADVKALRTEHRNCQMEMDALRARVAHLEAQIPTREAG